MMPSIYDTFLPFVSSVWQVAEVKQLLATLWSVLMGVMGQFMTAYVNIVPGCNILAVDILTVKGNQKYNSENCNMPISDKHMQLDQFHNKTSLVPLLQELLPR